MNRFRTVILNSYFVILLYRNRRLNRRVRVVVQDFDVLEGEIEDVVDLWVELERRKRFWLTFELRERLLGVVEVEVDVAERMNEVPRLETRHLRDHMGEQRIRSDIER